MHKTTLKLIKKEDGIDVIHMDSVSDNEFYIEGPNLLIEKALMENAQEQGRNATPHLSIQRTAKL